MAKKIEKKVVGKKTFCMAPGCKRPSRARGLCTLHYQRAKAAHGKKTVKSKAEKKPWRVNQHVHAGVIAGLQKSIYDLQDENARLRSRIQVAEHSAEMSSSLAESSELLRAKEGLWREMLSTTNNMLVEKVAEVKLLRGKLQSMENAAKDAVAPF